MENCLLIYNMFIYRRNKKTGKIERICVPDWEYCKPIMPIAPNGMGINMAIGSHASVAVLSFNGNGTFSWVDNGASSSFWLFQTSADGGITWTTQQTFSGSVLNYNATQSFTSGTFNYGVSESIVGTDAASNYVTGRSNVMNSAPFLVGRSGSYSWTLPSSSTVLPLSSSAYWLIQKSTNGGTTWTTYTASFGATSSYVTSSFSASTIISVVGAPTTSSAIYYTGRSNSVTGSF